MSEPVGPSLRCPKCLSGLRYLQSKRKYKCVNCGKLCTTPTEERHIDKAITVPMGQGVVIESPADFDLFLTSDWHCGANACDYPGLSSMIDRATKTKNARMIIGGDQMEMTPPGHHDGGRDSSCYLDEQIIRTSHALQGCADRIDLIYGGNHGRPRLTSVQIDPDLLLAYTIKARYATVPTVVQYRTPKGTVRIAGGHGRSGAKNGLLELEKLRNIFPNCHLYHLGHNHQLFAQQDGAMEYDSKGREYWSARWLCRTGSFMKYAPYARFAIMAPQPTGYLVAKIRDGIIKDVEVVKV